VKLHGSAEADRSTGWKPPFRNSTPRLTLIAATPQISPSWNRFAIFSGLMMPLRFANDDLRPRRYTPGTLRGALFRRCPPSLLTARPQHFPIGRLAKFRTRTTPPPNTFRLDQLYGGYGTFRTWLVACAGLGIRKLDCLASLRTVKAIPRPHMGPVVSA
jgi:hypothetical protein